MEKMDGKTMDIVAENVAKLKELFPEAFTEDGSEYGTTKDTKGTKKIDFEVLKELLGDYVSDKDERYSFTWNGKSKARMIAQTPSTGTLRPCKEESVDWDSTQNIFIEGDNLEVLKLLQKSYHKKVKMIYIDPPYNTGKDFVYKDNFQDNIKNYKEITGQVDSEGRNLSNNPETSGRYHTDWLNMMYPRLKLARNLLKDDGVIFISIDDNEVSNLRKMCDEIFGEENFVAELIWERAYAPKNDAKFISNSHDYVLMYSKSIEQFQIGRLPRTEEANARYKNPDNDPRGVWKPSDLSVKTYNAECDYPITTPSGRVIEPPAGRCWRLSKKAFSERLQDNRIWFGPDGNSVPSIKRFITELKYDGMAPTSILFYKEVGHSQEGAKEVVSLFDGKGHFDGPKPKRLLGRFLTLSNTNPDDLILDFFAGSATTAHAVMQLNTEDNGNRKFIMVQLPETIEEKSESFKAGYKTIADIGKERIRRAAAKIKEELEPQNTRNTQKKDEDLLSFGEADPSVSSVSSVVKKELDLGFKVFKLDSTNIKPWEVDFDLTERTLEDFISNIKTDRREEDVLYEILLKYGLSLDLPIEKFRMENGEWRIVKDDDKETLNSQFSTLYSIGMGALIICLADAISLEVVEGIAKLKDELNPEIMRVVFKDSGFKDDVVKTNAVQILKQAGIVDVRSI